MKPFVTSYLEGRTPIPCTVCNTEVKFKSLLAEGGGARLRGRRDRALRAHRGGRGHGRAAPPRARDRSRDQSYFLYDLTEEQLSRARFPLGELTKPEVREIAREAGLPNWDKPDSQEVCFVPNGSTPADFIRREAPRLGIRPAGSRGRAARGDSPRRWRESRSARGHHGLYGRAATRARRRLARPAVRGCDQARRVDTSSWGRPPLSFLRRSPWRA